MQKILNSWKHFKFIIFLDITFYKPKRIDLYRIWKEEIGKKFEVKCQHVQNVVLSRINVKKLSEEEVKNIRQSIYCFCSEILRRWKSSKGIEKHFLEKMLSGWTKTFCYSRKCLQMFWKICHQHRVWGGHRHCSNKVVKELKEERLNNCIKNTKLKLEHMSKLHRWIYEQKVTWMPPNWLVKLRTQLQQEQQKLGKLGKR